MYLIKQRKHSTAKTLRSASSLSRLCSMGMVEYLTRSTCSFQVHSAPSCCPLLFLFFFLLFSDSITLRDPLIDPSAVFNISNLPDPYDTLNSLAHLHCARTRLLIPRYEYGIRNGTREKETPRYTVEIMSRGVYLCFLNTIRLRNSCVIVNSYFAFISIWSPSLHMHLVLSKT